MTATNQAGSIDLREVDALVDGELDELPRGDLLRRFEQSPDGWRTLALAFLEGQALRQALTVESIARPGISVRPASVNSRTRTASWVGAWAASVMLAFAVGMSGDWRPSPTSNVAKMGAIAPPADVGPHADTQAAVAQTLTPAVRLQLERLGYRVQERPRVVSVKRSDGQTVQVLVNEVELRYVGHAYSL